MSHTLLASAVVFPSFETASDAVSTKNASALSAKSMPPVSPVCNSAPRPPTAARSIPRSVRVTRSGWLAPIVHRLLAAAQKRG